MTKDTPSFKNLNIKTITTVEEWVSLYESKMEDFASSLLSLPSPYTMIFNIIDHYYDDIYPPEFYRDSYTDKAYLDDVFGFLEILNQSIDEEIGEFLEKDMHIINKTILMTCLFFEYLSMGRMLPDIYFNVLQKLSYNGSEIMTTVYETLKVKEFGHDAVNLHVIHGVLLPAAMRAPYDVLNKISAEAQWAYLFVVLRAKGYEEFKNALCQCQEHELPGYPPALRYYLEDNFKSMKDNLIENYKLENSFASVYQNAFEKWNDLSPMDKLRFADVHLLLLTRTFSIPEPEIINQVDFKMKYRNVDILNVSPDQPFFIHADENERCMYFVLQPNAYSCDLFRYDIHTFLNSISWLFASAMDYFMNTVMIEPYRTRAIQKDAPAFNPSFYNHSHPYFDTIHYMAFLKAGLEETDAKEMFQDISGLEKYDRAFLLENIGAHLRTFCDFTSIMSQSVELYFLYKEDSKGFFGQLSIILENAWNEIHAGSVRCDHPLDDTMIHYLHSQRTLAEYRAMETSALLQQTNEKIVDLKNLMRFLISRGYALRRELGDEFPLVSFHHSLTAAYWILNDMLDAFSAHSGEETP